eukprot:Em0013g176a
MNYSDVEAKVREATNDDAWGPPRHPDGRGAKYTFTYEHYPEAMAMLWKRMFESKKAWRRTYKSLLLLHYLLRNGSERVVQSAREHVYDMKSLEEYTFRDEHGKDQGINDKEILAFIQDEDALRDARKQAKQARDKFVGISADEAQSYSDRYDPEPRRSRGNAPQASSTSDEELTTKEPAAKVFEEEKVSAAPYKDMISTEEERARQLGMNPVTQHTRQITALFSDELPKSKPTISAAPPPATANTSKKSSQPSKLIDLGAAATFANTEKKSGPVVVSQQVQQQVFQQQQVRGGDPFMDVFGEFSQATQAQKTAQAPGGFADFGLFQSAPSKQQAPVPSQPQFADFGSFQGAAASAPTYNAPLIPMNSGGSVLQPQNVSTLQPQQSGSSAQLGDQTKPKSSLWNAAAGAKIDMDNLLAPTAKIAAPHSVSPPSMKQLQQQGGGMGSAQPAFATPNYGVSVPSVPSGVGLGGNPGFGMGMGQTMAPTAVMGHPYATQPGMAPMYYPGVQPGVPMMGYPNYNLGPRRQ